MRWRLSAEKSLINRKLGASIRWRFRLLGRLPAGKFLLILLVRARKRVQKAGNLRCGQEHPARNGRARIEIRDEIELKFASRISNNHSLGLNPPLLSSRNLSL